jgi:hypothetical protein
MGALIVTFSGAVIASFEQFFNAGPVAIAGASRHKGK